MKKTALLIVVAAASMHGMTAAVPTPPVKIAGTIGERFDLTVRGNFMKLDLEKDFFRPFRERNSKGGFIGLGKPSLGVLEDSDIRLTGVPGFIFLSAEKFWK